MRYYEFYTKRFISSAFQLTGGITMAIALPNLAYSAKSLEPYISERTIQFHHGKHHKAYVDNTVKLIEGTDLAGASLEDIILKTAKDEKKVSIFNNAAQVFNHSFYWMCLKPGGGGQPVGKLLKMIQDDFGGYDKFAEQFKNAGMTQFGSGWAWLVLKGKKLEIHKTSNANNPLTYGCKPLLTVDVWEHAYYLDFQNRRADYLSAFLEHLVNWDFAASQLE
jgi:Fe-Mn family superoxide dismutase